MVIQWLQDFIQYLRFEKRYSPHTITAYETDITLFFNYLTREYGSLQPQEIVHFHIRSWLAQLKSNGEKETTINRKSSSLQAFYRYLQKKQIIATNPLKKLHALKLPGRLPVYLKEAETIHLLEALDFGEGFAGFTNRMICSLLYQTGMRRNELLQLKETDIEHGLRQIRIMGKGNKERLIPLGAELLSDIDAYIVMKKSIVNSDSDHLLVLENGRPLYAGYIYRTVKRYLTIITTQKKKSPHVLRHTFATHLLANGANIQAIKELLGHSSLAATQIYTHNNIEKLKEIHKMNHPRG